MIGELKDSEIPQDYFVPIMGIVIPVKQHMYGTGFRVNNTYVYCYFSPHYVQTTQN